MIAVPSDAVCAEVEASLYFTGGKASYTTPGYLNPTGNEPYLESVPPSPKASASVFAAAVLALVQARQVLLSSMAAVALMTSVVDDPDKTQQSAPVPVLPRPVYPEAATCRTSAFPENPHESKALSGLAPSLLFYRLPSLL